MTFLIHREDVRGVAGVASFQIYTIKMTFFTELHAKNIIYFDMHMKLLPKNELFSFLENC